MSVSAHIRLEKVSFVPKGHETYGDLYPYICEHLNKVAKRLKVTTPSTFDYEDPNLYAEMFGEDVPVSPAKRLKRQKPWHSALDGHETFSALLNYFKARPDRCQLGAVKPKALLYELEAFEMILAYAAEKKDLFRIETLA